jgi:hypothetical protein
VDDATREQIENRTRAVEVVRRTADHDRQFAALDQGDAAGHGCVEHPGVVLADEGTETPRRPRSDCARVGDDGGRRETRHDSVLAAVGLDARSVVGERDEDNVCCGRSLARRLRHGGSGRRRDRGGPRTGSVVDDDVGSAGTEPGRHGCAHASGADHGDAQVAHVMPHPQST